MCSRPAGHIVTSRASRLADTRKTQSKTKQQQRQTKKWKEKNANFSAKENISDLSAAALKTRKAWNDIFK